MDLPFRDFKAVIGEFCNSLERPKFLENFLFLRSFSKVDSD